MTVMVEGKLAVAGEKRSEITHGHAVVTLSIDLGPGYPAEARLLFREDHFKAEAVAKAARRGALVLVEAGGFFPRVDHHTAAVILTNATKAFIDGTPVFP
jgi:hypothetical protein